MMIPEFSSIDFFEYKTWALALLERLETAAQQLYEVLDDEAADEGAIRKALDAAEVELKLLTEARLKLPSNLAAALGKSTSRVAEKLDERIPRAHARVQGQG